MAYQPGQRVGSYEIVDLLGEGGMGAVYRALDPRLGREVAIKIVRPALATDPDLLARFGREARLLASLNHPHIATVHGLEESGGQPFLVLELVPGVTLAERLSGGALPLEETLVTAQQIAAAIEAAHDRGIIHRDLKPGNIKLVPGTGVKVLDFGLAKAIGADPTTRGLAESPTQMSDGTRKGTILGSAAYMSPEQARGKDVDKRTDVWAFGCVLYEMLVGKAAFAGDSMSDTIANVVACEPDWRRLPPETPAAIHRLLRRCLQKDPHRRLRDIGDARIEIEETLSGEAPSSLPAGQAAGVARATHRSRRVGPAAAALAAAMLTGAVTWLLKPAPPAPEFPTVQLPVALAPGTQLGGLDFPAAAIAPGDTHVAYVATRGGSQQLVLHTLSSMETVALDGTEGAMSPFFSPDGQWIAFFADGKLKKVPVSGGTVRDLADAPIGFGGSWGPDETIVFAPSNSSALWAVSAEGGAPSEVTRLDLDRGEFSHRWPDVLPDGSAVLFTSGSEGSWDDAQIVLQPLDGGTPKVLVHGGTHPRYLAGGRLLYVHDGSVFLAPLEAPAGRIAIEPARVLEGVLESVDGAAQYSVSRAGSLLYAPRGAAGSARSLVWVDHRGDSQPLPAPPFAYSEPRLSPDGRSLAVTISAEREDIWVYDIATNRLTRLTRDGGASPVWSSDGSRIFFSAARDGPANLFVKRADGTGPEERLTRSALRQVPQSVSPDGRLAFVESDLAGNRNIGLFTRDDRRAQAFTTAGANATSPAFSPDGRWIAWVADGTGGSEVFVAAAVDPARRVRISSGGGTEPVWRHDGRELYFRSGKEVLAATIGPDLRIDRVRPLFDGNFLTGAGGRSAYDISADGARFLMIKPAADGPPGRDLRLILNWQPATTRR